MYGRVVAIHSFISSSLSANFHVPITEYYDSWERLVRGGQPPAARAYFGATWADDASGCRLAVIDGNSPAFRAGLKAGDIVTKVDGRDLKTAATLQRWLSETEPGETLTLELKRGDKTLSRKVRVDPLKEAKK